MIVDDEDYVGSVKQKKVEALLMPTRNGCLN